MEIGNKDVYEYILNLADDKTTINMLRANPKVFDNEIFYEKVMRKRYPLLIEFRPPALSWKEFYLRMVYTLAKLEEDYKIPYIPTKGCNPEKLLVAKKKYDAALFCAASGDNIPLIDYFLEKGAENINGASAYAAEYGNLNTVKYLISKGADNYEGVLQYAASGGKVDTMKLAIEYLEGFDFNGIAGEIALVYAIFGGHIESINFLINNGARIKESDIEYAEKHGKHDIAEYLKTLI